MQRPSLIVIFLLALAGCGGGGTPAGDGGASPGGTLRIAVGDDPFPAEYVLEASVEVQEIEAHQRESDAWVVLTTVPVTVNLVGLTNGLTETILEQAIESGTYDRFRLRTGPGRVVLDAAKAFVADEGRRQDGIVIQTPEGEVETDGYLFTVEDGGLRFPSGPQTGLKVKVDPPIVVTTELSGDLLLEFDLGRNFVFNGPVTHPPGVKRVLFTPSVKASNRSENGSVKVQVRGDEGALDDPGDDLPLAHAEVWLEDAGGSRVTSTFSDAEGMARLSAAPGTYTLKADKFGYVEGEVAGVAILLANLADAGTLVLAPTGISIVGTVYSDVGSPGDGSDDYVIGDVTIALQLLDGASVVYEAATTSDASGSFTFDRLEEDTYDLTFAKDGFAELQTSWSSAGAPLEVHLAALFQAVTATVLDTNGNGVSGAAVTAVDSNGNTWTATADTNGDALLTLPTGTYTLTATDGSGNTYAAAGTLNVIGDTDANTSDTVILS